MENADDIKRYIEKLPESVDFEEHEGYAVAYIDDEGKFLDEKLPLEYFKTLNEEAVAIQESQKNATEKSFEYSNQDLSELGQSDFNLSMSSFKDQIVEPPYCPTAMSKFLERDDIHFRAIKTKVIDTVGKKYLIKSKFPIRTEDDEKEDAHGNWITEELFQTDCRKITKFLNNVSDYASFQDIAFKVGMDRESIGWSAFEVIREASGRIARLNHLPATRLRVLKGFRGFVEIQNSTLDEYIYYQPFGQKFGKNDVNPFDPDGPEIFRPYDPELDGELEVGSDGLGFNLVDRDTGLPFKENIPAAERFTRAANEVLYIPNPHSNTVYYGFTDGFPALGAIIANCSIRDFQLQFFEHNCVPRYAVIVKGVKVDDDFRKMITDYFQNKIKGSAHKTLVITLSGMGNKQIDIEFKRIDADRKEGDFLETRKSNNQIIMTSHGVSAAILGINDAASLGSGKGMAQSQLYRDRVVVPLQLAFARAINKLFRLGLGCVNAELEFDPFDIKDQLETAQTLQILLQTGSLTINEARRMLGVGGPLKGGDTAFVRVREGSAIKVEDLPEIVSRGLTGMGDMANNDLIVGNEVKDAKIPDKPSEV